MVPKIECRECKNDIFGKIPCFTLETDNDVIEMKDITEKQTGEKYMCIQCNYVLEEGLPNKPFLILKIVNSSLDKIKLATQLYNQYDDDIYFLMRYKKEVDALHCIIGDSGQIGREPNFGMLRASDDLDHFSGKHIFLTKYSYDFILKVERNYILCLTKLEYDQLDLDFFSLKELFKKQYNFFEE